MTQRFPAHQRRPAMWAAVTVAIIATGSAYLAMVGFGTDVLVQSVAIAYTTAGVFELSLITVALLAKEAAQQNRPNGTLLTLTWVLSSASGVFAAWHELFLGHELGAAVFRFLVPLLAALMWHLALIGDRHLASGRTWSSLRENARMHSLFLSIDGERRARQARRQRGGRLADLRVGRAERQRLRARAVALRTVPPAEVRAQVAAWSDALAAVDEATAEAVALADDDAARMTIHADLSPRHDRLTVTVPDQDEPAVEQITDTTQLAVEAGFAPGVEDDATAGASSDPDTYEARAADAVHAELSVIAGETDGHTRFDVPEIEQHDREEVAPQAPSEARSRTTQPLGKTIHDLTDDDLFTVLRMRATTPPASWTEIGDRIGCSRHIASRAWKIAQESAPPTPALGTPTTSGQATMSEFDYPTAYVAAAPGTTQRNDY